MGIGMRTVRLVLVASLILASGCAYVNEPLNNANVPLESRAQNHTRATLTDTPKVRAPNDDGYFVGLALSGGGSRSANFSAACMFQLQRMQILDRVDCISSVSGGSLAAAYYCLADEEWNPGNVQQMMSHSFANDMLVQIIQPWNFAALMMTPWDRADILARVLNNTLYTRKGKTLTFKDLRSDRPRLLINCTDLQSGKKFVFSNEAFDALNSDLSKYPIANAVAASSAVPVLIHHMTLRDYSTVFDRYVHLLDGGINDNLGVTSLVETYTHQSKQAAAMKQPDPYPHGMILIVIDAHTSFDTELGDKPDIGLIDSLAAGAGLTTTALLNRVSSATLADLIVEYSANTATAQTLREQIAQLEKTGTLDTTDRDGKPVRVIHLSLTRVSELTDLPFVSFGQRVNSIATYFNIDPTEAYHLYKAAELLTRDETFAKPLESIANDLKGARAAGSQP